MGMTQRGGDPACAVSRHGAGMTAGMLAGVLMLAMLVLGVVGCAAGGTVSSATPATALNGGTPGAHATLTLPTLTVSASPSSATGQQGAKEFCSKAPDVTIRPGSNIPVYPGASLNFSQANNGNAFYGYCTGASTSDVQNYYALQLRQAGWSGLQTSTISSVVQITAKQCAKDNSPQIIVTIAPDTTGTTTTSISIVVLGGSC